MAHQIIQIKTLVAKKAAVAYTTIYGAGSTTSREVPDDEAGQLQVCLDLYRKITGKEPTADDIAAAKLTLVQSALKP